MQDREIVAAIVARRPAGLAAAYDQYAPALHAYCRSLLAEPADAADAVQDTFIIASAKLGGLRDPDRLRPWLYAVARNECRRRLRARASSAPLDEAGEMTDENVDVGAGAERAELRVLVGAALAGLNPGEREIIELNLRHDLDGADLADALGVPRNQAHALASRARTQFETSLGALLVARSGREDCPDLDAILAGWDGQLTVLLRKRINRHIERCDVCGDRRRRQLSPAMLLSMLPVVMLPAGLRDQLFRLVADVGPAGSAYRARVIRRAEPFGGSGFPKPIDPPHPVGRLKVYTVAGVAAVVLLAVIGGGVVFAANIAHHSPPSASTLAGPPPTSSPPAVAPVVAPPSSSPPPSSAPATSAPAVVTTLPAPPPPQPTTATPTPKRTTKPPPKPGTLTASPNLVVLAQSAAGGPYTGTFTLTATGGPVPKFTITDTAPAGDLSISPSSGSLQDGATVTVTVTVVSAANLSYQTPLTITAGLQTITVTVEYPPSG
jgi:RNA polymerase sigma factor (sigma-70 family)